MKSNKKNTLWLAVQYIIVLFVSFITLKLNLINYGEKIFGIWIMLASVWGIGSVLDFGFGTAIVKYVAEANQENNRLRISTIASTGLLLFCLIGCAIVFTGNVLAEFIFYNNPNIVPPGLEYKMRLVFIILGLSFYFQYLSILYRSIFEGLNNFVISSRIMIINNLTIICLVGLITIFKLSIIVLSLAYMTSSLLLLILYSVTLKLKQSEIEFSRKLISFREIKKIFGFSLNVQAASLLGALIDPIIKYVISNYASVSIVPFYEIARRMSLAISGLFANSSRTILPRTSILKSREDYQNYLFNEGTELLNMGMAYSGTVFGAGALFLTIIIKVWFGFNESIIIFFILSLAESINNIGFPIYLFFMGIGKVIYLIILQSVNLVLISGSILLGFVLFNNYLGLFGYYISVLLANILLFYFLKKEVQFQLFTFLRKVKIHKLMIFNFLIIFTIVLLINNYKLYVITGCLSVISGTLFYSDIKTYITLMVGMLKSKMAISG